VNEQFKDHPIPAHHAAAAAALTMPVMMMMMMWTQENSRDINEPRSRDVRCEAMPTTPK